MRQVLTTGCSHQSGVLGALLSPAGHQTFHLSVPIRELPRAPLASINLFALQAQRSSQTRGGGASKEGKQMCGFSSVSKCPLLTL